MPGPVGPGSGLTAGPAGSAGRRKLAGTGEAAGIRPAVEPGWRLLTWCPWSRGLAGERLPSELLAGELLTGQWLPGKSLLSDARRAALRAAYLRVWPECPWRRLTSRPAWRPEAGRHPSHLPGPGVPIVAWFAAGKAALGAAVPPAAK